MIRSMTALVVLLCSADLARAECTVPAWRFLNGQQTNASMTTSSGTACSLIFRHTRGQTAVHGISISSAPANGSAAVQGSRITYKSRPGFKGQDSFTFALATTSGIGAATATVLVAVTVR